eukprot:TRINITY_DN45130_c0_g1_i1.p1 TRINITY_DN45130_c0_g1~~TRINITY_DN45130_c0_g1_i1.p1  ORF type:complete len:414 (-),score=42.34 TRINITY_DN45130_c0_g1_i1:139-1380(-)
MLLRRHLPRRRHCASAAVTAFVAIGRSGSATSEIGRDVTIGFGSCLMQSKFMPHERQGYRPFRILSHLAQQDLDGFVFMGDAVYADFPNFYSSGCCSRPPFPSCRLGCFVSGRIGTREQLDQQYSLLLEDAHFSDFVQRVQPVFTWDDHELFDNYREGMQHVYYKVAREAWERHLATPYNPAPYREGELYFVHTVPAFPQEPVAEFFVLDGRSHRSHGGVLGEQQIQDLHAWLISPSTARWRFVVSSTMFADVASGVGCDNWSHYPDEKRRVLGLLYAFGGPGLVVLSGDSHFVAIVEHRTNTDGGICRLVEVCSSPLASVPLPLKKSQSSYTGAHQGFDEEVKFLRTGSNLYGTLHLNRSVAVVRLWSYLEEHGVGRRDMLAEARVFWGPTCASVPDVPPMAGLHSGPRHEL